MLFGGERCGNFAVTDDASGDPCTVTAVADSSSFSRRCFFSPAERDGMKKDFDHDVRRLSFLNLWGFRGEGHVGGGSKKGIAKTAGEADGDDDDEEDEGRER